MTDTNQPDPGVEFRRIVERMLGLSRIFRGLVRPPVLVLGPQHRVDLIYRARERLVGEYAAARRGVRCQSVKRVGEALGKVTLEALRREVGK